MWNVLVRAAHTKPLGTLIPGEVRGWCQGIPEASEHGEGRGVKGFHALRGADAPHGCRKVSVRDGRTSCTGAGCAGDPMAQGPV